MPKRVVAISDTHSGHLVGLTPPIWHVDMERMPNIGALQQSMWNWYESVIEALQPIDVLLFLGDAIDGKGQRSGSTELLVTDLGEQCEAVFVLCIWVVICLFGVGWLLNLQNLFQYDLATKEFVLSLVGVFVAPVGSLTGWLW